MSLLRTLRFKRRTETLDPNTLYDILSNERRRLVLEYLFDTPDRDPISVRTLTEHLVEHGVGRDAAYVCLVQTHCPRLHDAGYINYQQNRKLVTLTQRGKLAVLAHRQLADILDPSDYPDTSGD